MVGPDPARRPERRDRPTLTSIFAESTKRLTLVGYLGYLIYIGAVLVLLGTALVAFVGLGETLNSGLKIGLLVVGTGVLLILMAAAGAALQIVRSASGAKEKSSRAVEATVVTIPGSVSGTVWRDSVQQASTLFLNGLRDEAQVRLGDNAQVGWLTESDWVGDRFAAFSMALAATTPPTGGGRWCDDHGNVSPLDDYFRPDAPPYHRCREHHPPHCYDDANPPNLIPCP